MSQYSVNRRTFLAQAAAAGNMPVCFLQLISICVLTFMICACGGGGNASAGIGTGAASGSGGSGGQAASAPTITAVSSTSATPATAIALSTTGLNTSAPVIVQLSFNPAFTVSVSAISVHPDGTVVFPVPIYVDPTTGNEGTGTASVSISQAGQTSAAFPTPINIQPLTNSATSLPLGQISHAFLTYEAMRIGRRLNEFDSYQALPGNTVDTTAAQATLQKLLAATVRARDDVDRITLNPSLVIPVGSLSSNGFPVQYDQYSVAAMDRLYALQVTAMAPVLNAVISHTPLVVDAVGKRGGRVMDLHGRLLTKKQMTRTRASKLQANLDIGTLLTALGVSGNMTAITQSISDYLGNSPASTFNSPSNLEQWLAIGGAFAAEFQLATSTAPPGSLAQRAGSLMGALVSGTSLLNNFALEASDLAFIMVASRNGTDPSVIAEAQADLQKNANAAVWNTINTELGIAGAATGASPSYWGSYGETITEYLASTAGQVGIQSAGLITAVGQCATSECLTLIQNIGSQLAAETQQVFPTAADGFADVVGTVAFTYSGSNALFAPDAGIQLGPFDSNVDLQTLADSLGMYDVLVPVGSPNTNYKAITDTVYDPVSNTALSNISIDLSMLTASASAPPPLAQPPIAASCVDTDSSDYTDPDEPDCE